MTRWNAVPLYPKSLGRSRSFSSFTHQREPEVDWDGRTLPIQRPRKLAAVYARGVSKIKVDRHQPSFTYLRYDIVVQLEDDSTRLLAGDVDLEEYIATLVSAQVSLPVGVDN